MLSREGAYSDEEVANYGSVGVETSIEESWHIYRRVSHFFLHLIFLLDVLPLGFVELPHRQGKITEV